MARIDLAKPYGNFLKNQVEKGYFRSITAAAEDVIRRQMEEFKNKGISSIHAANLEGDLDVKAGKVKEFTLELMTEIKTRSKAKAENLKA